MKKVIITYGTFDLLHEGHVQLLRYAKSLGDYLIVGLSTESFNSIKNKKSTVPYAERKTVLEAIRYVDLVIPEETWEQKVTDIQKYGANVFIMGDDWKGKFDELKAYCEVVYFPRIPALSSTSMKEKIRSVAPRL